MKRHFLYLLVLSLYLLPLPASAQAWQLDTATIVLGDQTTLAMQQPAEIGGEGIVVVGQRFDTTTATLYTTLTSFAPGEHWLHIGEDSVLLTVMDVEGVDTVSVEIKDITGILSQPYTFWEIFRWVLLALLVAGLVVAGIWMWRRHKEKKPIVTFHAEPPVPADVRALAALEALRVKGLWQQGRAKEYHTELTDIVRRYLAEGYGINSIEMTTEQTLGVFSASRVCTDESYRLLRQMLETADMVKFAKSEPPAYEHDRSMDAAVTFVNKIKEEEKEEVKGER